MAQRYRQASDTFVAALDDGSQVLVTKGDTKPESHEVVRQMMARDPAGADAVWKLLDSGEDEAPKSAAKDGAKPAPVKGKAG